MKHVAIYVRVSSKAQDQRSQLPDLERWVASQDTPAVWYRDKCTGRTMDRPGWNKLVADVEAGKVSKVVCWRLDRLGRTAKGLTSLFENLTGRKVGLFSLKDSLDLSTPAGRLMAHVLASVSVYENEVRSERIRAGQAVAKANGVKLGGGKTGRLISIKPEQVEQVRKLKAEGVKIAKIARAVSISRPTVYRLLEQA